MIADAASALSFGGNHLDNLAPARDQIGETSCHLIGQLPELRFGCLGKMGDHRRVDRIGLGSFAESHREGTHLCRIDDHHGQAGTSQTRGHYCFEAAGGLDRHQCRRQGLSQATRSSIPAAVRLKTRLSPVGRTATSRRSSDTSMPTTITSIRSHPCANGFRPRPKRLFGFDGTAGEDTHSLTGSATHRFFGLSPATPLSPISDGRDVKLQGFLAHRSH